MSSVVLVGGAAAVLVAVAAFFCLASSWVAFFCVVVGADRRSVASSDGIFSVLSVFSRCSLLHYLFFWWCNDINVQFFELKN